MSSTLSLRSIGRDDKVQLWKKAAFQYPNYTAFSLTPHGKVTIPRGAAGLPGLLIIHARRAFTPQGHCHVERSASAFPVWSRDISR